MTFADQSIYDRMFQKVVHKGGEFKNNYIKRFQNDKALEILVVNSNTEYKLMQSPLDNSQKGRNYYAQIASHQMEFRRKEEIIDQKSLSTSDLKIGYLNLENSVSNNERANFLNQCELTVDVCT